MPRSTTLTTSDLLTVIDDREAPDNVRWYADNIVRMYKAATPELRAAGLDWYPAARRFAIELASQFGITIEQAAATIAVLSPSVSWAAQIKYSAPLIKHILAGYDPATAPGSFYKANKIKAGRILLYGDLDALSGVKVTAFYANILGDHSHATIDRHALRIAVGQDLSPEECSAMLSAKSKTRRDVLAAYHLAAQRLGLAVALVQAVTWTVYRGTAD